VAEGILSKRYNDSKVTVS